MKTAIHALNRVEPHAIFKICNALVVSWQYKYMSCEQRESRLLIAIYHDIDAIFKRSSYIIYMWKS
jgi:hypothetical protein